MKTLPFYLALFFLAAPGEPERSRTPADWAEDIRYFSEQMVKRHKNAFHNVSKSEFDADVQKLLADVHGLPDYQVIIRLLQITAKIGDTHTAVHMPATFKRYPIVVNWFGDGLYVTATTAQHSKILGARMAKVGGLGLDKVLPRLATVLSQDQNKWFDMYISAAFIVRPEVLTTLGIAAQYDKATFTFISESGEEIEVDLVPQATGDISWVPFVKEPPLFRRRQADLFWFSYLKDINAVFVSFKNYKDLGKDSRDLFDFIDSTKASRLIVDLRFNGGGDFKKGRKFLIEPIKKHAVINQKGNLFVIPGRGTFSAAMVNAIDFKKDTQAIIVGEPPGDKPNSYSENDEMTLPNSRLVVSYSTEYYQFLDQDVPFEPDVRIDPDWENFRNGKDPVMEWIVGKCLTKP